MCWHHHVRLCVTASSTPIGCVAVSVFNNELRSVMPRIGAYHGIAQLSLQLCVLTSMQVRQSHVKGMQRADSDYDSPHQIMHPAVLCAHLSTFAICLLQDLEDLIAASGYLGPLIFTGAYATATVLLFPASLLTLAAGYLFGEPT